MEAALSDWQELGIMLERVTAIITDGGKKHVLRKVHFDWNFLSMIFETRYEGNGYTLVLLPEALLYRPDGTRWGECQ